MADINWTKELVRGGIPLAAVLIGGWITLKNYRSSKWWDAKLSAYEEVMVALEECANWYNLKAFSWINDETDRPNDEDLERFNSAWRKLRSRESRAKFMLSDAARQVLHDLSKNLRVVDHETSPGEYYFELEHCYKTALEDLVFQARVDMKTATLKSRAAYRFSRWRERTKSWVRRSPRFRYFVTAVAFGDEAGEIQRRRFNSDGSEFPEVFWKKGGLWDKKNKPARSV